MSSAGVTRHFRQNVNRWEALDAEAELAAIRRLAGRLHLPFAIGRGTSLFGELERPQSLRLVSSRAFPSGVLELVYEPAPGR
jgi:hypothetical protein